MHIAQAWISTSFPAAAVHSRLPAAAVHSRLSLSLPLSWTGAGHQKLLFNLLRIYKTKLWNFSKHPTKPLWMKYIYKITFWQSTICLKCLLVSLCTLMKTINFHHETLPKGNAPSNSLDPRYGQKYLMTISSFGLTLISNICSKITYSLGLLVQINKRNLFKLILYWPFFVICIFFHYVLLDILYLTDTAKLPFIMGLIFYICLSFDTFHLAVFLFFLCHINICIVKQTYINFSVLSTPAKLIIALWDCVCIGVHSSVKMFFCLFIITFSFHWLFTIVLKAVLQGW